MAKVDQVCAHCGMTFMTWPSRQRVFCSRACHADAKRRSLSVRFWSRINKDGPIPAHRPELGPCWVWTGGSYGNGYGAIAVGGHGGKNRLVHRVAYEEQIGPIPEGHEVLHHCDNHPCGRGSHLFTGTQRENMDDMVAKGRGFSPDKTHYGTDHGMAILNDEQVLEIRRTYDAGEMTQWSLARRFGVARSTIQLITARKSWRHI